jgi:hypothetical protein
MLRSVNADDLAGSGLLVVEADKKDLHDRMLRQPLDVRKADRRLRTFFSVLTVAERRTRLSPACTVTRDR